VRITCGRRVFLVSGLDRGPRIKVGILKGVREARFSLKGSFIATGDQAVPEGDHICSLEGGAVRLQGADGAGRDTLTLTPGDFDVSRVTLEDVTIGIDFHWERKETQQFQGALTIKAAEDGLVLINELPVEAYLVSVISSEMSASCPPELLRAHAVVSRSWLLAQLQARDREEASPSSLSRDPLPEEVSGERIRWYDRESHTDFDVCADDHCQRYQGISKAFSRSAFDAVLETLGKALCYGEEVCDARYSKSCGGMTEVYSAAWEEKDVAYLRSVYDGPGELSLYRLPLSVEANAEAWITSKPGAYCDTSSEDLLSRILPGFDQETRDFYRWQVRYTQEELAAILRDRLEEDLGPIRALEAVERGLSGRLVKLRIRGEKKTLVVGKELEIRRVLSRSHLYSSAFVVRTEVKDGDRVPDSFLLIGAGWGHGVGLCQIGAAVLADSGRSHEEILAHYFRGADLRELY
jgi:SpoIID/LytB domain protein